MGGENPTDYMEALTVADGAIPVRPSLVKSASSLVTIASGGSIGREGSMVKLTAVAASWLGRRVGRSGPSSRLLTACGAAAGLASVYDAPIAGALFVSEIIITSVVAALVARRLSSASLYSDALPHSGRSSGPQTSRVSGQGPQPTSRRPRDEAPPGAL